MKTFVWDTPPTPEQFVKDVHDYMMEARELLKNSKVETVH